MPVLPDDADALADWLSGRRGYPGAAAGAAARRQARPDGDRRAATPRSRSTSTSSSAPRTSPPGRWRWASCRNALEPARRRRCASSASTSATCRAPTSVASMVVFEDGLARKSEYRRFAMRVGDRRHRLDRRGRAPPVRALPRRAGRVGADADSDPAAEPAEHAPAPPRHRPDDRPAAQVRLPAEPARRRRRRPAGRRGAGRPGRTRHRRRRAGRAGQAAGGGVAARPSRSRRSCRGRPRGCTCCSGCATRRTGSRSPTTGRSAPRR